MSSGVIEWDLLAEVNEPFPEPLAQFGMAISIYGTTAVVWSRHDDGPGYAYVYTLS